MFDSYFTQNLREDEELIAVLHSHPVTYLWSFTKTLLLIAVPLLFSGFFLSHAWSAVILLILELLALLYGFHAWFVWYFDSFLITSQRIIDIQQKSIFHRSVSETALSKIQDLSYTVPGFFGTLFNYGTIAVSTASDKQLSLTFVSRPQHIQEVLAELLRITQTSDSKKMTAEELVAAVAELHAAGRGQKHENHDHPAPPQPPLS